MKKIIINGPQNNVFSGLLEEKAGIKNLEIELTFIQETSELKTILSKEETVTVIFINKNEGDVQKIKQQYPRHVVIMCHGGGASSQPFITFIASDKNHQDIWFEDLEDFFIKIQSPPERKDPLFSALEENDWYQVNYANFPELVAKRKGMIDQKLFWFNLYFSRIYLAWFKKWLKEVNQKSFSLNQRPDGPGKQKRLKLSFDNQHLDELIFRDGGEVVFGNSKGTGKCFRDEKNPLIAKVISTDTDGIEVEFDPPVSKSSFDKVNCFCRGGDILSLVVNTYAKELKKYSDFSIDGSPSFMKEEYYYQPEAYLRGYIPNENHHVVGIEAVNLGGKARKILRDESQAKALMDMLDSSFISVIEGRPGAGKTFLTAVAIKQFILQGRIVLVTSHSNQGLDNLLAALSEHIDSRSIFRLGNSTKLISPKAREWHRSKRYRKLVEKEKKNNAKKTKKVFDQKELEVFYESEDIWQRICKGEGVVLAVTVNSFKFDNTLTKLQNQNGLVYACDFEKTHDFEELPKAVVKFMANNPKGQKPSASFSVGVVDEATKGLPYEIFSILMNISTKLILIGDTKQLGNIEIQAEIEREVMRYIKERLHIDYRRKKYILYPNTKDTQGRLMEQNTDLEEILSQFTNFSEGIFFSLSSFSSQLLTNRRSLPEIVRFINYVFEQNLKVGRFNARSEGKVTFIDVKGRPEKRVKTSYRNLSESAVVVREILNFFKKQKKEAGEVNLNSLGVIAMYNSQLSAIEEKIRKHLLFNPIFEGLVSPENIKEVLGRLINTVDSFQGSERDVIIVSLVRSNEDGRTGFASKIRRLYVAITRARNELLLIGNAETFLEEDKHGIFRRIVEFTRNKKTYARKKLL